MQTHDTCQDCVQPLTPHDLPPRCKACWGDKAAAQSRKEDQLPFPKLCAKLRQESAVAARQARRQWQPAHARLFPHRGDYAVVDGYVCTMTGGGYRCMPKERLYPLAEYWTRMAHGTQTHAQEERP